MHSSISKRHNELPFYSSALAKLIRLLCKIKILYASALLFLLLTISQAFAEIKQANLVFAADMPIIDDQTYSDYAELSSFLTARRQSNLPTFFLFGGGSIGPSPMSAFDRGSHIIDVLNSLEPDAMGVTKREFSYFEDELSLRSYEAAFPIIASNLFDPLTEGNLDGLTDSTIIQRGGFKLGVVSLINQTVVKEYLLERVQVIDPENSLRKVVSSLRKQGADFIVLLYSNGFPFVTDLLEQRVINLALLTDPHFELSDSNKIPEHSNSVHLTKPGQIADIRLSWDTAKPEQLDIDWQTRLLKEFPKAAKVTEQVAGYSRRLNRLLNEEIGSFGTLIDTTRPVVRSQESAFGNLLADSLRDFYKADVGLINGGVIRGERIYQPKTKIARRDIAKELPFRTRVVFLKVTGEQLIAALENGMSQMEDLKGRFPHVSGLTVHYNSSAPPGNRILSVLFNGKPVQNGDSLTLATSDYLASGGDGYESLRLADKMKTNARVAPLISDVLINKIRIQSNMSPTKETRLVDSAGSL